jgi:indolepyruvate ferredoxin oxidoreductase beta subunit
MADVKNILLVGVGGQGVMFAGELLSKTAFKSGQDVKKSEVHGMAQRGGVVSSHVRYGEKVYSPLIPQGECDVMLAFEQAEALRWLHFMKSAGTVIVTERKWVPPIALMKGFVYPQNPLSEVQKRMKRVIEINAQQMAESLGNPKVENMLLLGALSTVIDLPLNIWQDVIRARVPKGTEALNLRAFDLGLQSAAGEK